MKSVQKYSWWLGVVVLAAVAQAAYAEEKLEDVVYTTPKLSYHITGIIPKYDETGKVYSSYCNFDINISVGETVEHKCPSFFTNNHVTNKFKLRKNSAGQYVLTRTTNYMTTLGGKSFRAGEIISSGTDSKTYIIKNI